MSVGAGGDALVRYRLLQRRHLLLSGGQSVSGPSRWLIMNGLGSIWLRAACWENVGGGGGGAVLSPFHSHLSIDRPTRLFLLISASSSALVPATSNSFCRLLFFFNSFCYSSSAPPSLCSISLISPPSFSFSFSLMFLPQHRHQLADVSSSFHLSSLLAAYSARGRDINMHTEALG